MPKYDDYDAIDERPRRWRQVDDEPSSNPIAEAFSNALAVGSQREEQPWMKTYWRPAIAWSYLITCLFDFIIFPILWSMLQAYFNGTIDSAWQPITLHGAGLYHLAMGAAIGISAYSRGREKLNDKF